MKAITAIGIVVRVRRAARCAAIMEGDEPDGLPQHPRAVLIVVGGTVGATMASTNLRSRS